jgi:hypothetical protein
MQIQNGIPDQKGF